MWKEKIMAWAVLAACAGLVVACGGGGGGASNGGGQQTYTTLAPYAALPSDATCAAQVRAASRTENRPDNAFYNATTGKALPNFFNGSVFDAKVVHSNQVTSAHISGNFTGTTEDILRWGACKWGIDENVVKAMAANESQWQQAHRFNATNLAAAQAAASAVGNTLTYHTTTNCANNTMPGGVFPPRALPNPLPSTQPQGTGAATANCSRDWGILQLNYEQHPSAWPEAEASTAMNVDVVLAIVRACYDGDETWISTKAVNPGAPAPYAQGDLMGCVGRYNSGAWYDANAITYIGRINAELVNKTWTLPAFQNKAWVYP